MFVLLSNGKITTNINTIPQTTTTKLIENTRGEGWWQKKHTFLLNTRNNATKMKHLFHMYLIEIH